MKLRFFPALAGVVISLGMVACSTTPSSMQDERYPAGHGGGGGGGGEERQQAPERGNGGGEEQQRPAAPVQEVRQQPQAPPPAFRPAPQPQAPVASNNNGFGRNNNDNNVGRANNNNNNNNNNAGNNDAGQQNRNPVPRPFPSVGSNVPGTRPTAPHPVVQPPHPLPDHPVIQTQAPGPKGGNVVTQQHPINHVPTAVSAGNQHIVTKLPNGGSQAVVVAHDRGGREIGRTTVVTNKDGSWSRQNSLGVKVVADNHGLQVKTVLVSGHDKVVFKDKLTGNQWRDHQGVGHDIVERGYWNNRTDHFVAWRNHPYWGIQRDWFVWHWDVWGPGVYGWYPGFYNWYCPTIDINGFCVERANIAWDWYWPWWTAGSYHYASVHEYLFDHLFSRYWLYRHEEEADMDSEVDYWRGEFAVHRPFYYFADATYGNPEAYRLVRAELGYALREANEGVYYDPSQLVALDRAFIPGTDYSEVIADSDSGESCTLTRGSVLKITSTPTDDNPYAEAVVVHSYDPHDGGDYCDRGTNLWVPAADLVDMSNDFRLRVQDAVIAQDAHGNYLHQFIVP